MSDELLHPVRRDTLRRPAAGRSRFARFLYACSVPVIGFWLVLAGVMNLSIPQLESTVTKHAQSFLPDEASSVQALVKMGKYFGGGGSNNFVYVLLEGDRPLGDDARAYYTELLSKLTADTKHVGSAMDLWSNPELAPVAESRDGKVAYVLVNLTGNMGTALAMESTQTARDIIAASPPPPGITAHVTGPSAVVNDEMVAINDSMILLIVLCSLLVSLVLILAYRSVVTALVPLLGVGIALAVARAAISLLAELDVIQVSIFAASLSAVVVLGAGTNYGIFLVGRYQESRRNGLSREDAYYAALAGVQHIVIASALTVAGAMACLAATRLAMFSTSGLPCTIAILVTLAAALTLGPAILAITTRLGFVEPRESASQRRWHRIAAVVARWPGPVLAGALAILAVMIVPLAFYAPSYNERRAQPSDSPANVGFAAADRHLPPNIMAPSVLIVESDHDMRNSADLLALANLTDAIASIDGISAVQGITRPLGQPFDQGSLTSQAAYITNRFTQMTTLLRDRLTDIDTISTSIDSLDAAIDGLETALQNGAAGADSLTKATTTLATTSDSALAKVEELSKALAPARGLISSIPQCPTLAPCQTALTGLSVIDTLPQLRESIHSLANGTKSLGNALPGAARQIPLLRTAITQTRQLISPLRTTLGALIPQTGEITSFVNEVSSAYAAGNPGSSFFLPSQALESPLFKSGMPYFFSADGKATRMVVTPEREGFSRDAMDVSARVIPTALTSMKSTSLAGSTVSIGGPGGTLLNIESFAHEDFIAIIVAAFAFVFCVVLVLLRSLIAALAVIGTVGLSYLAAMGIAVFLWQDIIGNPLHWSVAPIAFTFLVAVGADYNMLLVSRLREEYGAGPGVGLIRAMVGTGSVVTQAGLTFGATMFAMLASYAHNVAQIGTTVGIGLVIDTLIVRTLVMPALARLSGRWFWWPTNFVHPAPEPARPSATAGD
ncbi:MMPL/RND family transporter [Tsukamurella ocularis]|uniref:MMPL/RND family transporter n=1 Tax=Tsukamurella ocularis TaxID=1970234 RepID=UPI0021691D9E|nr:RND family transporter [Tsukamurella ocularis]